MKITNVSVTNLEHAIVTAGFPCQTEYDPEDYANKVGLMKRYIAGEQLREEDAGWCRKRMERVIDLGSCDGGESHDCYLCGITVQFNVTAPRYWFPEMQRYHFADIISSFSTMHCLKKNLRKMREQPDCLGEYFSTLTDRRVLDAMIAVASETLDRDDLSESKKLEIVKANLPEGYLQTCRITTNYRQLKTWLRQREDHRLSDWREVCLWINSLPLFRQLTGLDKPAEEQK